MANHSKKREISVIGGGFSGLTAAYYLTRYGFQVTLFEKSFRLGGLIETKNFPEGMRETAANALILTDQVRELFTSLGVDFVEPLAASKRRFIFRNKKYSSWPLNIFETLFLVIQLLLQCLLNKGSLAPRKSESVEIWGKRLFGSKFTKFVIEPGFQGIYAGDLQKMSAPLTLTSLFQSQMSVFSFLFRRRKKSMSTAPRLGMSDLTYLLKKKLIELGTEFRQMEVKLIEPERVYVIATSINDLESFDFSNCNLEQKNWLLAMSQNQMSPLVTVAHFFEKPKFELNAFGCLFPRNEKIRSLAVLHNNAIFSERGQLVNETWILGGALDRNICELSKEELIKISLEDRINAFSEKDVPTRSDVIKYPKALPHLTQELAELLQKMPIFENLYFTGNYLGGLGLARILDYNEKLARKILKQHGN